MGNGNDMEGEGEMPDAPLLTPHGEREQVEIDALRTKIAELLTPHGERERGGDGHPRHGPGGLLTPHGERELRFGTWAGTTR